MELGSLLTSVVRIFDNKHVALGACAFGRALDVATTWVAIDTGRAAEAKQGTAQLFDLMGVHSGIIAHELLITTPIIFMGYAWGKRLYRRGTQASLQKTSDRGITLLYSIGLISLIVAQHNLHYLL